MKRSIRFRSEIPDDIRDACRWYHDCGEGFDQAFLVELQATLKRIAFNPHTYAAGYRQIRSARLHRFPYIIHYRVADKEVVIFAVIHGSRHPSTWQSRADSE